MNKLGADPAFAANAVEPVSRLDPSGINRGESVWSEHLTDAQLSMVMESGGALDEPSGFGVELRGPTWAVARALVSKGVGNIEGDPGGDLPGLYFNNVEGVRIAHEFDEEDEQGWGCPECGLHREHSHDM